jgi:hypothetical protein
VLGAEADFQGTGIDHSGSGLLRGVTTGAIDVPPDFRTKDF